jgi:hypothetical protein
VICYASGHIARTPRLAERCGLLSAGVSLPARARKTRFWRPISPKLSGRPFLGVTMFTPSRFFQRVTFRAKHRPEHRALWTGQGSETNRCRQRPRLWPDWKARELKQAGETYAQPRTRAIGTLLRVSFLNAIEVAPGFLHVTSSSPCPFFRVYAAL